MGVFLGKKEQQIRRFFLAWKRICTGWEILHFAKAPETLRGILHSNRVWNFALVLQQKVMEVSHLTTSKIHF